MKYRKKPVVIEAIQWEVSEASWNEIQAMGCPTEPGEMGTKSFYIPTLEGKMMASELDWIIKGVNGEFYPCKPDIFDKTYEPVSESDQPAPEEWSGFTRGPWFAVEYSGCWTIQSEEGYSENNILDLEQDPNAEANAMLMVKAPEMYQQLQSLIAEVTRLKEQQGEAVDFAEWIAENNYQTSTMKHERPQLWQNMDVDRNCAFVNDTEWTSAELYNLFTKQKTLK